jgi:hypothetical protein
MDKINSFDSLPDRIKNKVVVCAKTGCWNWKARKDKHGYGRVRVGDVSAKLAHRLVFEIVNGTIDSSLVIDHLCRNRGCVNPLHMEQVSAGENTLRGTSFSAVNKSKDFCANGHALTDENTYIRPNGNRDCRACIRNRVAAYDKRRKEKAA